MPNPSPPLVSVLIRSMDRPELDNALQSVATQTYPNIEVVLVNARGAEHRTLPSRCGRFPMRWIDSSIPLARSRAANVALGAAEGEFLLFLDDDDSIDPNHISKLARALVQHPDAELSYTGVRGIDENKSIFTHFEYGFSAEQIIAGNFMPIHSALFRQTLLGKGCAIDEQFDLYEDWDFWIQVAQHGRFQWVEGVSATYYLPFGGHSDVHKAHIADPARQAILRKWHILCPESTWFFLIEAALIARTVHQTEQRRQHLEAELSAQEAKLQEKEQELAAIFRSRSWQLTRPLRAMVNRLKKIRAIVQKTHQRGFFSSLVRAASILKQEGISGLKVRLKSEDSLLGSQADYLNWLAHYSVSSEEENQKKRHKIQQFSYQPLISIILPVYNPPLTYLKAALASVNEQLYENWELCIADDASPNPDIQDFLKEEAQKNPKIKLILRPENGHIVAASNSALSVASGEFIALLDHDDALSQDALFWVVDALQTHRDAHILYSDEDKLDGNGQRCDPYFKSDWNLELFLAQNMICHLGVYQRQLVMALGGFRSGLEGSQDYDLALRCVLNSTLHQIVHIRRILYHWRMLPGSTALAGGEKPYAQQAGIRALEHYLHQSGLGGWVEIAPHGYYRIHTPLPDPLPLVSLIIPTRNAQALVQQAIDSILSKTTYPNYEILLIDNGSNDPKALAYFDHLGQNERIRVIRDDRHFNYSALNNTAVQQAKGTIIGLINNDIEVIYPQWLEEMVSIVHRPGVGAVGARLWYPNNTLQHGGVIVGLGGVACHAHSHLRRQDAGYFARAVSPQVFSAVTAACLLVRKSLYEEVGGLNETDLTVAFNDVDFCLKLDAAGYRNVWTPYAELYHHESASRGYEDTPEKQARFNAEIAHMQKRWGNRLLNDPYYNPNLTLNGKSFSLAWPPRVSDE